MKNIIIKTILFAFTLSIGVSAGWWANSPGFDLLCSSPAVYTLGKDIKGDGISIKSGTEINLRSCEYANRFSIEMYFEKGNYPELFIFKNSATNIGNHGAEQYNVSITE